MKNKFNFRGNRPRMGKRSMCPLCGLLCCQPAGNICPKCGKRNLEDVSYEDKKIK